MLERLLGDEELAKAVLRGFLADLPRQVEDLRGCLEAGDAAGAERRAHTIKGAAANVGGEALRALAFEMERAGKAGDLESIKARLEELGAAFEEFRKGLAEMTGGEIAVESVEGRGSELRLAARLGLQTEAEPEQTPPPDFARRKTRILLAEDCDENRFLVETCLKNEPCAIDWAENGQIALDRFLSHAYDIIFMDVHMPVMDGYTATREIRRRERLDHRERTPIIALTANVLKEEVRMCLEAGCDAHLGKPVRKALLLEAVRGFAGPGPAVDKGRADNSPREPTRQRTVVHVDPAIEDMIPEYLANRRRDVASIHKALDENDWETIRRLAHGMKGSGGGYGFEVITDIGGLMEKAAKDSRRADIVESVTALTDYLDRVEVVCD